MRPTIPSPQVLPSPRNTTREASKPWAPLDIIGPFRFLQRAWRVAVDEQIELPVQIGGKVRARVTVDTDAPTAEIEKLVLADEKVKAALAGRSVRKVVVVPGRIVNIVAG